MDNHTIELETPRDLNYNDSNNSSNLKCQHELSRAAMSETFGMYIFIVLSLGNVAIYSLFPESRLSWDGLAISWGLNLMFGLFIASFNSKAHLNPAISLCMYLFEKNITFIELLVYTCSQLLGAFLAAATVYCLYFNNLEDDDLYSGVFVTYKNSSITTVVAFFTEFIGTALLAIGIFSICDHPITKNYAQVYIGVLLSALTYAFGYQTAFAWNPARDFAPRVFAAIVGYNSFSYKDYYFWIPLVAPYAGAVVGVFIYKILIQTQL